VPVLPESTRRYCKRQFFWTNWTVRTEVVQKAERSSRKYIADRRHKIEDRRPKDRLKLQLYPHLWSTSLPFETQVISTPLIHVIIVWNSSQYPYSRSTSLSFETQVTTILQIHVIIVGNFSHYPYLRPTSLSFETQVTTILQIHVIIAGNFSHLTIPQIHVIIVETQVISTPPTHVIIVGNFSHYPYLRPTSLSLKPKLYLHLWSTSLSFETSVISTPLIHVIIVWNFSHIHTADPRHYRWNFSHIHTSDPRHYPLKPKSYPYLWFTSLSFETQGISIPLIHVIIVRNFSHYPHFIPTSLATSHTRKSYKKFYSKALIFSRATIIGKYPFIARATSGSHEAVK